MTLRNFILALCLALPLCAAENIKAVGSVAKANVKAIGAVAEANIKAFGPVDNTGGGSTGGGSGVPVFVGEGTVAEGEAADQTTSTPGMPTHDTGYLLIAKCYKSVSSGAISASAGWTEIVAQVDNLGSYRMSWWYRVATSSSDTAPTFTFTALPAGNLAWSQVYAYSGVNTTTPFEDATASAVTTDTTPTSSAVDVTGADRLIVISCDVGDNTAWSVSPPPSGWTENTTAGGIFTSVGSDGRFLMLSIERDSGTEAAVAVGTLGGAEGWATLTLALIPD